MFAITDFQSSLLREKFIIHDPDMNRSDKEPITALSNRMVVSLRKDGEDKSEDYVIRAQNMHLCVRFAGRILQSYNTGGSLLNRANTFDWESAWEPMVNDYERMYNEDRWVAVYHRGKTIFKDGEHHSLLDLIEKCDFENDKDYEYAIPMAENAFKQSGKVVKINYDANVALVTTFEKSEGRCGVILRGADGTTTFNYKAVPRINTRGEPAQALNIPQCLSVSAAFLEGVQLAFMVGMNMFKIRIGIIEGSSKDEQQTREAQRRLGRLNAEIANLDSNYDVRYRPEKPEFHKIMSEAEELAARVVKAPAKKPPKPFGSDDL